MFDNTSETITDNSDVGSTSTDDSENESKKKEDINHEVESSSSETNESKERDGFLKCVIVDNELRSQPPQEGAACGHR